MAKKVKEPKVYAEIRTRGMMHKVELIEGKLGVWYDAAKFAPNKNGRYLAIMETLSPVRECQSWAGMGVPEYAGYNDNYDTSKWGVNWTDRGSLTVAYWTVYPKFDKEWVKQDNKVGFWQDKMIF